MVIEGVPNVNNNTGSDTVRSTYQALTTTQKKTLEATDNGADLSSSVSSIDIAEYVPEKLDNGKYDRLTCYTNQNGIYILGKMEFDPFFPLWFKPFDKGAPATIK